MEIFQQLGNFVLHIDQHLATMVAEHGTEIYMILFAIVFCETGLVIAPFLPGDSLLFAAGAVSARGSMDYTTTVLVLIAAAFLGDNLNYWVGRTVGPRVMKWEKSFLFNKDAFDRAHAFFEKHGSKALVAARFMPIFRTFAPFTAGVARMDYRKFVLTSFFGGVFWVMSLTLLGYMFGNITIIKENIEYVIVAIIVISFMPAVIGYLKNRKAQG